MTGQEYVPDESDREFMERIDQVMPQLLREQGVPAEDVIAAMFNVHDQLQKYTTEMLPALTIPVGVE